MEQLRITIEGKVYDVTVEKISSEASEPTPVIATPAARPAAAVPAPAPTPVAAAAGDAVSPLAGIVKAVEVAVGASVKEGDLVITLEAMKMYTPINAEASGKITAIHVKEGDAVEEGQVLYTIG